MSTSSLVIFNSYTIPVVSATKYMGVIIPVLIFYLRSRKNIYDENIRKYAWILIVSALFGGYIGGYAHTGAGFSLSGEASWHRAVLAAFGAVSIAIVLLRLPFLLTLGTFAPYVSLSYAIFRVGCFLSGDSCFGIPTDLPWGVELQLVKLPLKVRLHPTPMYETIANLVLAAIFLYTPPCRKGRTLAAYLISFGLIRLGIEQLKLYPRSIYGMTEPEVFCILIIAAGLILLLSAPFSRSFPASGRVHSG